MLLILFKIFVSRDVGLDDFPLSSTTSGNFILKSFLLSPII